MHRSRALASRAEIAPFLEIPNIGPAMASDLVALGFKSPLSLAEEDPQALYERLNALDGVKHDVCVLDTFASAIHWARTGEARPWWEWSRARKAADTEKKLEVRRLKQAGLRKVV